MIIFEKKEDLMAKYENPIEHACDVQEGQEGHFIRTKQV